MFRTCFLGGGARGADVMADPRADPSSVIVSVQTLALLSRYNSLVEGSGIDVEGAGVNTSSLFAETSRTNLAGGPRNGDFSWPPSGPFDPVVGSCKGPNGETLS